MCYRVPQVPSWSVFALPGGLIMHWPLRDGGCRRWLYLPSEEAAEIELEQSFAEGSFAYPTCFVVPKNGVCRNRLRSCRRNRAESPIESILSTEFIGFNGNQYLIHRYASGSKSTY